MSPAPNIFPVIIASQEKATTMIIMMAKVRNTHIIELQIHTYHSKTQEIHHTCINNSKKHYDEKRSQDEISTAIVGNISCRKE